MTQITTHIVEDLTVGRVYRFKSIDEAKKKITEINNKRPMVKANNEYQPKLYTVDEYMEMKGIV